MASLLGGLTGGGGPLGGLTGGLAGDGGPLGGLAGGLTSGGGPLGGLTSGLAGDGGPLGGLTGSLTGGGGPLGGLTSGLTGDGGPLGGLTSGLTGSGGPLGGLLGGGEGLNLIGLVGIGSDDPALLDLNPAEKKAVKAQKAAQAKQNEQKRQQAFKQLQEQVRNQGGRPTPQQEQLAQQLQQSQQRENQEMQKLDQVLGPTDPFAYQQAVSHPSAAAGQQASRLPAGTYQAYIIDPQTRQPTHLVTFQPINSSQSVGSQGSVPASGAPKPAGLGGLGGVTDAAGGAGGLLGGLLGSGQGLNVAGILAIGSDEKALLDLNPAQKKEDRIKQAQALAQEKRIQDQQIQALKDQVAKQGNRPTSEQQQQYETVLRRQQALREAAQKLETADRQQAYGVSCY